MERIQSGALLCKSMAHDLLTLWATNLSQSGYPAEFDAVLLDAPCSNTGVIQRRRTLSGDSNQDLSTCRETSGRTPCCSQSVGLPGGRLVYSTCSIEAENIELVEGSQKPCGAKFKLRIKF